MSSGRRGGRGGGAQRGGRGRISSFSSSWSRSDDAASVRPPKINLSEVEKLVEEAASAKDRRRARLNQIIALGARPTAQQRGKVPLKMLQGLRQMEERREKRRATEAKEAGVVLPSAASRRARANVPNLKKRKRDLEGPSKWAQMRGDRAGISGTVADPASRRALKPHIGRYQDGVVSIAPYQINRVKRTKLNS